MTKPRSVRLVLAVLFALAVGITSVGAQSNNDLGERGDRLQAPIIISLPDVDDEDEDDDSYNPDPPCFDDDNRFVDCGNGTVTDQVTGLIWLQETICLGVAYYTAYNERAASLGEGTDPDCNLTDGSCPGDWRLATKEEWEVIFSQAQTNGCSHPDFVFPDTEGLGCWAEGDVFHDVTHFFGYWTSTTADDAPGAAWYGDINFGGVSKTSKTGGCDDIPPGTDCDPFPEIYGLPVRSP